MIFQLIGMFVGGARARKAKDNAARFLRDGDWRSALEEYREVARFHLGERKGEEAMVAVLDVLEREGFDTGNLYVQYLGLAAWSSKHIKGPRKGVGQHLFELIVPFAGRAAHQDDMKALQWRTEDVFEQFGLFWSELPHLVEAGRTRDEAFVQRPLLSPNMLRALLTGIRPAEGETEAEARRRLVESLPSHYRAGDSTESLMEEVDSLRAGGVIGVQLSDRLVDVLLALPTLAGDQGGAVRMWRPWDKQDAQQLVTRRQHHSGLVNRRAPAGVAQRTAPLQGAGTSSNRRPTAYWVVMLGAWIWIVLGAFLLLPFLFGAGAELAESGFDYFMMAGVPSMALVCSVLALLSLRKRSQAALRWAWATAAVTCLFCVGFIHLFILFAVDGSELTRWLIDEQERRLGDGAET
jgi:hypothetical protein